MNQRLGNLSKWTYLAEGQVLEFHVAKPRTVILEVNCQGECCFFVTQDIASMEADEERLSDEAVGRPLSGSGEPRAFLGLAKGRDRFEFAVTGPFDLEVEGADCWVYSVDGLMTASRFTAPEIFTRIANRRQRNPHMEMMEYTMRVNVERRLGQLEEESARRVRALEQKLESYAPQRDQRAPAERTVEAFRRTSGEPSVGGDPAGAEPVSETAVEERPLGKKRGKRDEDRDQGED